MSDAVERALGRLRGAPKYRDVHPDTLAAVVAGEVHTGDDAGLEARARTRLHRVAALHLLTGRPAALRRAVDRADADGVLTDPDALRPWCRDVLATHVSTAERLPDLDAFYGTVLASVPAPDSIADLACALNPFTVPWLRDHTDARYTGHDLNAAFVGPTSSFLATVDRRAGVEYGDVLTADLAPVDVALLLKTYHCIEDRRRGAALDLVAGVAAGHVVVSFPTRAMNGRAAVFARRHIDDLTALAEHRGWPVRRTALPTEEFVVIDKRAVVSSAG